MLYNPIILVPKFQETAQLIQSLPVINTWYTVFDFLDITTLQRYQNIRINQIALEVEDADETVEINLTLIAFDGLPYVTNCSLALTANTPYYVDVGSDPSSGSWEINPLKPSKAFLFDGKCLLIEIMKSTALGTGDLVCKVHYGVY